MSFASRRNTSHPLRSTFLRAIGRLLVPGLLALLVLVPTGCGNDDEEAPTEPPPTGASAQGLVSGTVSDVQGAPLGDVLVATGTRSTSSNAQGYYALTGLPESERLVVRFSRPGYATSFDEIRIRTGTGNELDAVLKAHDASEDIDAEAGGTVSAPGGGSVSFGAGALATAGGAPFTGTARVDVCTFDPTDDAQRAALPGQCEGTSQTGETRPFNQFGAIAVAMTGGGGALDLAAGESGTITMPIPAGLQGEAPASIALWAYDADDGRWHEEGEATKVGNGYEASVTHLSSWAAGQMDAGAIPFRVSGRVVDGAGGPVEGARVTVTGLNFSNAESSTPADGTFSIETSCGAATVRASRGGASSPSVDVQCSGSAPVDVGDLAIESVPRVRIVLSWGAAPRDLDLHLTIPNGGGWTHLYYPSQGLWVEGARLDTDDRDGYGPEIITIADLHDGVYRASVHHYAGDGTITSSGASMTLAVEGVGVYPLAPPAGGAGAGDVWRLWDLTVTAGKVTQVSTINDFLHGKDAGDIDAFTP